jgi:hypothetical protein
VPLKIKALSFEITWVKFSIQDLTPAKAQSTPSSEGKNYLMLFSDPCTAIVEIVRKLR